MLMLYNEGSITKNQYDKYITDKNNNESIGTAVTTGGIIFLGYLINNIFDNNND